MERKTKVQAQEGTQNLLITREFDLPVEWLFEAHTDPEIFGQWMSHEYGATKVVQMENKKLGSYIFETSDANGNVVFRAGGTIHEFIHNKKITRTFEMDNTPFDVQLEFLEFEKLTDHTSRLTMYTVFRLPEYRDQMLKMPFAPGLDMAHNRLQDIVSKLK